MSRASRASLLFVLFFHNLAGPAAAQNVASSARVSGPAASAAAGAVPAFVPTLAPAFSGGLGGTLGPAALPGATISGLAPAALTVPAVLPTAVAATATPLPAAAAVMPPAAPAAVPPEGSLAALESLSASIVPDSAPDALAQAFDARKARGALPDVEPTPLPESSGRRHLLGRAVPAASPDARPAAAPDRHATSEAGPGRSGSALDRAPGPRRGFSPRKLLPAVLATIGLLALDWGAKALFVSMGWPFVYHELGAFRILIMQAAIPINLIATTYYLGLAHSDEAPLKALKRFRERHPVVGAALYGLLWVLTFPVGLGEKRYAGDLPERHPAARTVQRILTLSTAAILAASLGNGLEAIHFDKVVDFIPFGHGRMNLADAFIFLGLPMAWMGLDFFGAARKSEETGRPMALKTWRYYLLPVLGTAAFYQLTALGYAVVPLAGWYILVFSTLFLLGVLAADIVFQRLVESFNQSFERKGGKT